jgi:uncharacterized protein (DUF1778 family)
MTTQQTVRPQARKSERLEARVSREQKELFQRAADLQGSTLTEFLMNALQEAATRTVSEHGALKLGDRDREVFINALLSPPEPNDTLRRAASEFQATFRS